MSSIINVQNIVKEYKQGEHTLTILKNINFQVEKGAFISIVGPSGSGKSTLLHILGGVDSPTSGKVMIDNQDISKMNDSKLSKFRRKNIGFIFQSYNLIPVLNVKENIILPIKLNKGKVDKEYIDGIIQLIGLSDRLEHYPNQLSGGQQQRVAIARALAHRPKVVFADEPTGNLDSKMSEEVLNLLRTLHKSYDQTLVLITHDNHIAKMSDKIVTIKDGILS